MRSAAATNAKQLTAQNPQEASSSAATRRFHLIKSCQKRHKTAGDGFSSPHAMHPHTPLSLAIQASPTSTEMHRYSKVFTPALTPGQALKMCCCVPLHSVCPLRSRCSRL